MHSKRNSSLPKSLINIAIGVKNPKKIKLITMGLTIDPSKSPNLNHNLFNGKKISDFKTVIKKNYKPKNSKKIRPKTIIVVIEEYECQ